MRQYAQLGGIPCNGTAFETKECGTADCPSKLMKWYNNGHDYSRISDKTSFHIILYV